MDIKKGIKMSRTEQIVKSNWFYMLPAGLFISYILCAKKSLTLGEDIIHHNINFPEEQQIVEAIDNLNFDQKQSLYTVGFFATIIFISMAGYYIRNSAAFRVPPEENRPILGDQRQRQEADFDMMIMKSFYSGTNCFGTFIGLLQMWRAAPLAAVNDIVNKAESTRLSSSFDMSTLLSYRDYNRASVCILISLFTVLLLHVSSMTYYTCKSARQRQDDNRRPPAIQYGTP